MRKLISILLMAIFGLSFVLPMLAMGQNAEAGLPACCRRHGKHHCMMSMDECGKLVGSHDPQFKAPTEKCPYSPSSVASARPNPLAAQILDVAIYGALFSQLAGFTQTEAKRRISRDRSNGKRGPPALTALRSPAGASVCPGSVRQNFCCSVGPFGPRYCEDPHALSRTSARCAQRDNNPMHLWAKFL